MKAIWIACLSWALLAMSSFSAFGQFMHIAPDLPWDGSQVSHLGVVNVGNTPIDLTVKAYAADGSVLGTTTITLSRFARQEWSAAELVSLNDREKLAWASVDASAPLSGYVRWSPASMSKAETGPMRFKRKGTGRFSIAPLAQVSGDEVWVPQASLIDGEFQPVTVLTNASAASGSASSNPVQTVETTQANELPSKILDPTGIPGFGQPFQQTSIRYNELFKDEPNLQWDHITSNDDLGLASVQHFLGLQGVNEGRASLTLPRTAHREMIIAPMQPNNEGFYNKIVLVNTYPGRLPVEIDAYFENGVAQRYSFDFDPFQKVVFDVNAPTQLQITNLSLDQQIFPGNFEWLHIKPYEGGLIGYQLFGTEDGLAAGAAEASVYPSGNSTLPYTPNNSETLTRIGIVNTTDTYVPYYVAGFDDSGRMVDVITMTTVGAYSKVTVTTEELFGDLADQITWCRVGANRNQVMSWATIEARDGSALGGFQGFSHIAHEANVFEANFEHLEKITLDEQNWYGQRFILPARDTFVLRRNYYSSDAQKPDPGTVFQEWAWDAHAGYFYFGYEPVYQDHILLDGTPDAVVYWSDFIEVPPQAGPYYFSFWMRFINPQDTTTDSQYGMVWREEGSTEAHWFGFRGIVLEQPPIWIRDCWVDLPWRDLEVTVTQWFPLETELPASLGGKRIQVGYYYNYLPDSTRENAPYMFIDDVRIGVERLPINQDFGLDGGGTVTIPLEGAIHDKR